MQCSDNVHRIFDYIWIAAMALMFLHHVVQRPEVWKRGDQAQA